MSADAVSTPENTTFALLSPTSVYSVLEVIGEGGFSNVFKCENKATKKKVAVKVLKKLPGLIQKTDREVAILSLISSRLDPDENNLIKFYERFQFENLTCLAFEMLEIDLFNFMAKNSRALSLSTIRPIGQQLLVALDALKSLGIIHTDIKPDNVMISQCDQEIKVKVIDFGEAIKRGDTWPGQEVQVCGHRAPEVFLGLPFNEAIDVWAVGCVLAFLFLPGNLFSGRCEYQTMKSIVEMLGQPDDRMLREGLYSHHFFIEEKTADDSTWRLLTPEEFREAAGAREQTLDDNEIMLSSLDDLVEMCPDEGESEPQEILDFVDLLKMLLEVDGNKRICPKKALLLPFFQRSSLNQQTDEMDTGRKSVQEPDCPSSAGSGGQILPSWLFNEDLCCEEIKARCASEKIQTEDKTDSGLSDGEVSNIPPELDPDLSEAELVCPSDIRCSEGGWSSVSPEDGLTSSSDGPNLEASNADTPSPESPEEETSCDDGDGCTTGEEQQRDSSSPAKVLTRMQKIRKRVCDFFQRITAPFRGCMRAED